MLRQPRLSASTGSARRDASRTHDEDDDGRFAMLKSGAYDDDRGLSESSSSCWQPADDERGSPVSVATPRHDTASHAASTSLPRSDATPHSLPTSVSYGDVIDEVGQHTGDAFEQLIVLSDSLQVGAHNRFQAAFSFIAMLAVGHGFVSRAGARAGGTRTARGHGARGGSVSSALCG